MLGNRWLETVIGEAPVFHVDLGTGLGHFTAALATAYPQSRWLAIEIDGKIARRAAKRIARQSPHNTAVLAADARQALLEAMHSCTITHLWINFPDPWPKDRHHDRRHTWPPMWNLLIDRIQLGGWLHLTTDVPAYAAAFRQQATNDPRLCDQQTCTWRKRAATVETKYERKWRDVGRKPLRFSWRKIGHRHNKQLHPRRVAPPAIRGHFLDPGVRQAGNLLVKSFAPRGHAARQQTHLLIDPVWHLHTRLLVDLDSGNLTLQGLWTDAKANAVSRLFD